MSLWNKIKKNQNVYCKYQPILYRRMLTIRWCQIRESLITNLLVCSFVWITGEDLRGAAWAIGCLFSCCYKSLWPLLSAEYYALDLCPRKQKKEIVVDTDRITQYTVTSNYVLVDVFSWGILARVGMFFF